MEKYMFSNTASYFIKATLFIASFLTIQNAVGMEEAFERKLNPGAPVFQSRKENQYPTVYTPHEHTHGQAVALQSTSSIWVGATYFPQDDWSAQYNSHLYDRHDGEHTYDDPYFGISIAPLPYAPYEEIENLLLGSSRSAQPLYANPYYADGQHSLPSTACTEIFLLEQDAFTLTGMLQSYMAMANLHDGNSATYCKTVLKLAELINDKSFMVQAYVGLGIAGDGQDYGITHYKAALTLLDEYDDLTMKAFIHRRIADVLTEF